MAICCTFSITCISSPPCLTACKTKKWHFVHTKALTRAQRISAPCTLKGLMMVWWEWHRKWTTVFSPVNGIMQHYCLKKKRVCLNHLELWKKRHLLLETKRNFCTSTTTLFLSFHFHHFIALRLRVSAWFPLIQDSNPIKLWSFGCKRVIHSCNRCETRLYSAVRKCQ